MKTLLLFSFSCDFYFYIRYRDLWFKRSQSSTKILTKQQFHASHLLVPNPVFPEASAVSFFTFLSWYFPLSDKILVLYFLFFDFRCYLLAFCYRKKIRCTYPHIIPLAVIFILWLYYHLGLGNQMIHTSPGYRRDYVIVLPSKWHDSCVVQCPLITCSFSLSLELIQISLLHLLCFLCFYPNFFPNSSLEVYSLLRFSQT